MSESLERVSVETQPPSQAVLEALQELIPGAVSDGVIDAQRIGEAAGLPVAGVNGGAERFGLMWAGKSKAVEALQAPSMAALAPDMENSINWDTAENVFIEGDNLEVLKLLQKAYNDQVKLIYIDPPYNTGNDFVYNDDFSQPLKHYLEVTGQVDGEGNRLVANTEVSGRKHSNWLSMMYPRLVLARNVLTDDGFIFVSINDIEFANLRKIMDEIFGEENFIEAFIWESIFRPSNLSKIVRKNAEYVLCYARNSSREFSMVERKQSAQGEASLTQNNNPERTLTFPADYVVVNLPDGTYPAITVGNITLNTEIQVQDGKACKPFAVSGKFKWSQAYLDSEISKGVTLIIKSDSFIPYYRKDYQETSLTPTKLIPRDVVGDVLAAGAEVSKIMGAPYFSYPKPTSLIEFAMRLVDLQDGDIVLDFFAGSGTTGQALAQFAENNKVNLKYVLINISEEIPEDSDAYRAGMKRVSDITRARLLKVASRFLDSGFDGLRIFNLSRSSFVRTDEQVEAEITLFAETLATATTNESIVSEVLLKSGVRLDQKWDRYQLAGEPAVLSDGVCVVLGRELNDDIVEAAKALEDAHTVIFLEDSFAGRDAVKANAVLGFKQVNKTMKTI